MLTGAIAALSFDLAAKEAREDFCNNNEDFLNELRSCSSKDETIETIRKRALISEDDFYAHFREKKYLSEHYKDYCLLYMHQFFRLYYDYIVYNGIDGFPENNYETFFEDMVNRMNMTLNISMKLKYPLFSTDRTVTFAKVIETLSDYCFLRPKLDVYDLRNINVYQIAAIRCLAEAVFDSLKKNDGGQ